jgi:Cu+-exporting ATPase
MSMRSLINLALATAGLLLVALVLSAQAAPSRDDCRCRMGNHAAHGAAEAAAETDPVCSMSVDAAEAKQAKRLSEFKGKTYYFCSDRCKKLFDADPEKYTKP